MNNPIEVWISIVEIVARLDSGFVAGVYFQLFLMLVMSTSLGYYIARRQTYPMILLSVMLVVAVAFMIVPMCQAYMRGYQDGQPPRYLPDIKNGRTLVRAI